MVERIVNNTRISNLDQLVLFELKEYEKSLQDAYKGGLSSPYEDLHDLERWTILRAVFFSSTVITTIGKSVYVIYYITRRAHVMIIPLLCPKIRE